MTRRDLPLTANVRWDAFWSRLRAAPEQHDLFETLRWVDALSDAVALGRAAHPGDEPLRLGEEPSLAFAASMLAAVRDEDALPRVTVNGFGLFGPNGPLPHHLTEYTHERVNAHGDRSMSAFADWFHHRLILLFYRAWADAQPVVGHDRSGVSRFDGYVASLIGRANGQPGAPGTRGPAHAQCFHAGHWVRQTRNPEGLVQFLRREFGAPARIVEHVVHWMPIDAPLRTTLHGARPTQRLGESAMLGRAVRDGQSRFRIVLGPMLLETYRTLLPGGTNAPRVARWVREYVGSEFAWELRLELAATQVPALRLGAREGIGRSTWLGVRRDCAPANDVVIDHDVVERAQREATRPAADARI
ncbi:type VI secretion system protein ImpH (plasmid) [Paraburkholderia sp. PGU19]|uniref:type VI secretion system baseplate subunit TssG n=1 Tax=Paraburkholderia sp. PGU19 TaxID=2735434 RepID=UPI0015DCEE19|nr:type VI secretion system baseplate subunit TssG [Paraburkholderia sp. PGU19]BCG04519.1 type VI secretion system protein ImpH [Paraburkholderia sp. PGU19]